MSILDPGKVFQGFWVDRSQGGVLGATLTTTPEIANAIVAILSVLVTFAGAHLWDIVAYIVHGALATKSARDGIYHQRQMILRNISSPSGVALKLLRMHWWWRQNANNTGGLFTRLDLLACAAVLCAAGFLVAGILSSQIVTTTNIQVLAKSASCGFTDETRTPVTVSSYGSSTVQESIRYAHDCYNASRSDPACQIYTTQSIPFATEYDACPFEGLCTMPGRKALNMDTGMLWSDHTFGINVHHADALAVRQVTKCAPLNTTLYETTAPMDSLHSQQCYLREPLPGELMVNLAFGSWPGLPYNDTITSSSVLLETINAYTISIANSYEGNQTPFQQSPWQLPFGFEPINPLRTTKGDLSLITIDANQLTYVAPVDDPFFSAHKAKTWTTRDSDSSVREVTVYGADKSSAVIGCAQQYQFCTPNNECTELTHAMPALSQAADLKLDSIQNVTLYTFAYALVNFVTGFSDLLAAPAAPLLAKDGAERGVTSGLPPNQWELEVKYWTAIILASIQKHITDFAVGHNIPKELANAGYLLPPGPTEAVLCGAQKMMGPNGFSNVSVFGLSFTLSLCGMIILVNLSMEAVLRCLSRQTHAQWDFIDHWDQDELLQFQRSAYEINGIASWIGQLRQVPVVVNNEHFEYLKAPVSSLRTCSVQSVLSSTPGTSSPIQTASSMPSPRQTTAGVDPTLSTTCNKAAQDLPRPAPHPKERSTTH